MSFRTKSIASKRVISKILALSHGIDKAEDSIINEINLMYLSNGGKWSEFFNSSPKHIKLLKAVTKKVAKRKSE